MRGRIANPIAVDEDVTPQATISLKVTPTPLGQKHKINLTKVSHTQPSLTLRLKKNCPSDPGDTLTPLDPTPKEFSLEADNLLLHLNRHLHDRLIKNGYGI
jgi:hypothetical protein